MAVHSPLLHRLDAVTWHLYAYSLSLTMGGVRKGLVLCLKDAEGERWGEIAPYPGRNRESLEQAEAQLIQWLHHEMPHPLYPSVQFGLESALAPLHTFSAPLYAFFCGPEQEILQQAAQAAAAGYTHAKVKLSSKKMARRILDAVQDRFRLRIDCNQSFSLDEAVELFAPYAESIEYIEDPIADLGRLREFPLPFALDEPLSHMHDLCFDDYPQLRSLILKPTVLGGMKGCKPWVEKASKRGVKTVFSPAYESGLGLLQILSLAHRLGQCAEPIGIATYPFLADDILKMRLNLSRPTIDVPAERRINPRTLTEIAHGHTSLPHFP